MANIALVPKVVNLALYAGDGVELRLVVKNSDGTTWDLNGEVEAQIRAARADAAALESFAVDMADAAVGVAVLSLTGDQTSQLVADGDDFDGAWDVQYTPTGDEPTTLLQGGVTCGLDVTR